MRIAIINLTAGGMSGGYRKYLQNVLPRMAESNDVEEIFCATPPSIDIQSWFSFLPKVNFITCKPFSIVYYSPEYELKKALERFSPDVIFIPVERYFKFDRIPIVNMIQNMESFVDNLIENSVYNKAKERYATALKDYKKFIRNFPESEYLKDVNRIHDNISKKLEFYN